MKLHRILALFYIFGLLLYTVVAIDYFSRPPLFGLIGLGSIASSIFILITHPAGSSSSPKNIIFGYLIAILIGFIFQKIIVFFQPHIQPHLPLHFQCLAVMAVVTVIIIFHRCNIDHPPAVGMTLGLVLESWEYMTIIVLIIAVTGLLLIPKLFNSSVRIK
ncbi:HPP family protein [Legionella spiritensis]|uniref:HPP family protein n=1 Tax=Legionella spiritensis TaxID=452 RepID=A0A0W0Z9F7_LEGSP|nr:HPP family protein [Legionella spiritensis]KTD65757.1 HPP family protein [Legionella spiritensis]SNV42692.1 HPP family [Legionella spiritensis]